MRTLPCPRTDMAGRSCSASGCAATSLRTTASLPGSRVITTSTGPTVRTTVAEKRLRPLCRKVITALMTCQRTIEIWGDGEQTRSFMYIDDCIYGTQALMASDVSEPINLGSDELVAINQLVDAIEHIAGVKLERHGTAPARSRHSWSTSSDGSVAIAGKPSWRLRSCSMNAVASS
jgi:nucleoside-diphosphate-sugar epimerase